MSSIRENPAAADRKLHRAEGACRELALEGHAVLPAHRQAAAGAAIGDRHHLQAAAAFDLRRGRRAATETCWCIRLQPNEGMNLMVMIKEPGPGGMRLIAGAARHVLRRCAWGEAGRCAGRLRAADHGRDPRQPDPVHARRRGRGGLGLDRSDPGGVAVERRGAKAYTAGTWGPAAAVALIERDGRTWHDGDE